MFQISSSPAPRVAVSTLSALAALGASGMALAAPIELEPAVGAYGGNTWSMNSASGMRNWLTANTITYHGSGAGGPSFARWNIDFAGNDITSAVYRIDANNSSYNYGIPVGASVNFALITEAWDPGVAAAQTTGPLFGTTDGVDSLSFSSTSATGDADYDITTLLQTWDANPAAYYGVRLFITQGTATGGDTLRGGVRSPDLSYSGNLIVDVTPIPEPAASAIAGAGALLALRRRRC